MRRLLAFVACLAIAVVAPALASAASPPELTSTTPASPANNNAPVVEGTADSGATVRIYSSSACDGGVLGTGAASGAGEFSVAVAVADNSTTTFWATADDGVVSACSSSSVTYVEDSLAPSPPLVLATSPTSPSSVNTVAIIGFASLGTTVRVYTSSACSGPPAALGSGGTFNTTGLPVTVADDTTTTFWGTAEDLAGNVSSCSSQSILYLEDSTAPDTTILTGPELLSGGTDATFTFTATEPGTAFQCDLDGLGYGPCSSPATYAGLTGGSHTFSVRAIDPVGNLDGSPDAYTWEIDLSIPQTTLSSAPDSVTNETTASFEFGASVGGASFECSIDSGPSVACTPPATYPNLADGTHAFAVTAISSTGSRDPSAATHTWTVDTAPPDTTLTSGPAGTVTDSAATFEFSASEGGSRFECRLDGGAFLPCAATWSQGGISDGQHTFRVRARDLAGNADPTPAMRVWTIRTSLALRRPGKVRKARAVGRDGVVSLRWRLPGAPDLAFVEIRRRKLSARATAGPRRAGKLVFRGAKKRFVDRKVRNNRAYQYTIVAVDLSGNRSRAVKRVAFPTQLYRLPAGAVAVTPPLLRWTRTPEATYYNIQLFRNGTKVLSAWPNSPRFRMRETWRFRGRVHRFAEPGRVDWLVFPAFGARIEARFGKLLGRNHFLVQKQR